MINIKYDYEPDFDILHIYTSEIYKGIKGCFCIGDFTFDVNSDNKIVGIEIEQASKILGLDI